MIFRRKLDLDIADVRPELIIVRNAAFELRESTKLKKLLQVGFPPASFRLFDSNRILKLVLAVGNALNSSSFRGGARGFKLDALLKVKTRHSRAFAASKY